MNLSDPGLRAICQCVLAMFAVVLTLVGGFALAVAVDWHLGQEVGPGHPVVVGIGRLLPGPSTPETGDLASAMAALAGAAPLVVTSVCFTAQVDSSKRLTAFGIFFSICLLVAVLVSACGFLLLHPSVWKDGHDLGQTGLANVQAWAKSAMQAALFYLATLFGLKVAK